MLLIGLVLATEWVHLPVPDVSWLLYVAGRVSGGAEYGVDIIDVAPPPIIWYSVPAVWLGHWTHLTVWQAYLLTVVVTGLVMLWLVREIARRVPTWDAVHRQVLFGAAALATYVLPWAVFGEREHVALVLVLPYVLLFAARESRARIPLWLAVVVGALAGFGFAIKPHFVVPWAALALAALWRRGEVALSRRGEFVAASLAAASGIVAVLALQPGYVGYMRRFGSLYLQYVPQDPLFVALVGESNSAVVVVVAMVATAVLWRSLRESARPVVLYLLVAATGFHAVALLQLKGWRYHYLPGLALSFVLLLVLWMNVRPPLLRLVSRAYRAAALATVVVLLGSAALGSATRLSGSESATFDPNFERLLLVVQRYGGSRPVAVLSANLASAFPLASEAGVGWASRYGGLPWLPAFYEDQVRAGRVVRPRPYAARSELEHSFGERVVADLRQSNPGLIIIPVVQAGGSFHHLFDYLAYFDEVPGFRELLKGYRPIGRVGSYSILQHRTIAAQPVGVFPEKLVVAPRAREWLSDGGEKLILALLVVGTLFLADARERRRAQVAASSQPV